MSVYEVQGVPMATTCVVTAGGYTTRCPCMRHRLQQSPNGYYVCSYSRRLHYSVSVYEVQGVPMATTCVVTAGGYTTRCPCMRYRESQWLLRVQLQQEVTLLGVRV